MPRRKKWIICGPSASGKSTFINRLVNKYPDRYEHVISHTTRSPRQNERHGIDYYFVSFETMTKLIEEAAFIQTVNYNNHIYGTSYESVKTVIKRGKQPILDITIQGAQVTKSLPSFDAKYIFIMTSLEELERRLRARGGMDEQNVMDRLARAESEIAYGTAPGNFDLVIINENLDEAYDKFENFVIDNNGNLCCADP